MAISPRTPTLKWCV